MQDPNNWKVAPEGPVRDGTVVYLWRDQRWQAQVRVRDGKHGLGIEAARPFRKNEPVLLYGVGCTIIGAAGVQGAREQELRDSECQYKARYILRSIRYRRQQGRW